MARRRTKQAGDPGSRRELAKPGDRVEAQFDGATLSLYQAPGGGVVPDYLALDPRSLDSVTEFARRGLFLPVMFDEDNGCTARLRLGDADGREADEWVGRVAWRLDLRSGRLGCNGVVLAVPPGEYHAEVCLYFPSTSATRIHSILAGGRCEAVWDYWMRTRPGAVLPGWMVEQVTSQDEEVVPAELLPPRAGSDPFAGVRVKAGGKWRELPWSNPTRFVDVVVRLGPPQPTSGEPLVTQTGFCWGGRVKPKVRPSPSVPAYFLWEGRVPERCPAGLPSESFPS